MKPTNKGLHHITIIAGPPQDNAEFYVHKLGLRLVLKSVNQDDPGTYHFFYANGTGQPGSSITFFPFKMASATRAGTGEAVAIAFSVPDTSVDYWNNRLKEQNIESGEMFERFGYQVLPFKDPDGLQLELVFDSSVNDLEAWDDSPVPAEHGIRGFWSSTLLLENTEGTARVLEEVMGFEKTETSGNQTLYRTGSEFGNAMILEKADKPDPSRPGKGTVHHVAFRAKNADELLEMRRKVIDLGLQPTNVIDRHVFKSVYFQSPGGVLFEIASDDPGYKSVVEKEEDMGKDLFLPPWLEGDREAIESRLEPVVV